MSNMDRRSFLKLLLGGGLLTLGMGATKVTGAEPMLRPPGALDEIDFLATCARCGKCAEICETGCIKTAHGENGLSIGTPYIEPLERACNLCMKCIDVCPTGALRPIAKEDVRMGKAIMDKDLCITRQGHDCRVCHASCPMYNKAIYLEDFNYPTIDHRYCVGCGTCVNVCMANPKALRIKPVATRDRKGHHHKKGEDGGGDGA